MAENIPWGLATPRPIDFSWLGNLPTAYMQAQQEGLANQQAQRQQQTETDLAQLLKSNPGAGFDQIAGTLAGSNPLAAATLLANRANALMPHWAIDPNSGQEYNKNSMVPPSQQGPAGQSGTMASPAQRVLDQDFAKTLPEWQSTGLAEEKASLSALDDLSNKLKGQIAGTGPPISGQVPGALGTIAKYSPFGQVPGTMGQLLKANPSYANINYPQAAAAVGAHVRAVANGMKAILGSQRAEAVIQQVIDSTYSADLKPEDNLTRITRLRNDIASAGEARQAQAKWFRDHNGSLAGYQGPDPAAVIQSGVEAYVGAGGQQGGNAPTAPQQAGAGGAPQAGMIVGGFRFKGGNPNDQNSWEPAQ